MTPTVSTAAPTAAAWWPESYLLPARSSDSAPNWPIWENVAVST